MFVEHLLTGKVVHKFLGKGVIYTKAVFRLPRPNEFVEGQLTLTRDAKRWLDVSSQ